MQQLSVPAPALMPPTASVRTTGTVGTILVVRVRNVVRHQHIERTTDRIRPLSTIASLLPLQACISVNLNHRRITLHAAQRAFNKNRRRIFALRLRNYIRPSRHIDSRCRNYRCTAGQHRRSGNFH